jgi:hypothetical protein
MSVSGMVAKALVSRADQINGNDCTFDICSIDDSYYGYQPSLAANAILLGVFALSCLAFLGEGVLSRRFIGFTIAMVIGTAGEAIGYVGRIMMHNNPWADVRTSLCNSG